MISKVLSVYDSKAEAYMRPFTAQSTGAAIRSFTDEINSDSPENQLSKHPEDYYLVELGTFDELTGTLIPLDKPKTVLAGLDALRTTPLPTTLKNIS
jgi:hypothetical protein